MNRPHKKRIVMHRISVFLLIFSFLSISVEPLYADDCEIVNAKLYQREQSVIVTDWLDGVPYKKYKIETYPCANITFRNSFWQGLYSTDIEVTATFTDQSTKSKKIECEKKRLEPGEKFSCSLCFESNFPISSLACRFR